MQHLRPADDRVAPRSQRAPRPALPRRIVVDRLRARWRWDLERRLPHSARARLVPRPRAPQRAAVLGRARLDRTGGSRI